MISNIKTIALNGIQGELIEVQTSVSTGLPEFSIVGLPDTSVKEAKERVKTAIKSTEIDFPSRKILINLSPANTKKWGTSYDLPMAIGILKSLNKISNSNLENTIFIGELSLDGKINHINGILPMCIEAFNLGIRRVILPKANEKEASIINGIEVVGVTSLEECIKCLNGKKDIKASNMNIINILKNNPNDLIDFSEVKGQENVKRALEIAAAGGHNCILIGSPRLRKNNVS